MCVAEMEVHLNCVAMKNNFQITANNNQVKMNFACLRMYDNYKKKEKVKSCVHFLRTFVCCVVQHLY